ncbi:IS1634 family transposase, partial [Proteiniclasticum sp. BAD-10]
MSSIQVYTSNGHKYVRIIESYRVPGHKNPKIRVLKNLGREDKLEAKEPGIVERLKREHNASRAADAAVKQEYFVEEIRSLLQSQESTATAGFPLVNYGVEVYEKLWNELKLDYFFDYRQKQHSRIQFKVKDMVSLLVYSRLLNPGSKKRTFENRHWFAPEEVDADLEKIYRTLPFLANQKENLEKHLNKQLSARMDRDLSVAFYDVTTYYFESVRADDLKRFGYSKDNKVNQVQVVMGLLIDSNGIPISYELFPGNTNDFKTLEPVMRKLKADYGIKKVIITADRGLNSKQNLAFLKSVGYEYVMAYKIRSSSKEIKEMVLSGETYHTVSKEFKWKVCNFSTSVNYEGRKVNLEDQMVITWSASREAKDRRDRERLIE